MSCKTSPFIMVGSASIVPQQCWNLEHETLGTNNDLCTWLVSYSYK